MKTSVFLGTACLTGALALLIYGFAATVDWNWIYAALVCGGLLAGGVYKHRWLTNLGFLGLVTCCGFGAWLKWPLWHSGAALLLTLAAWDLAGLINQLRQVNDPHTLIPLQHLAQAGAVFGLGVALIFLAQKLRFSLSFETALILIIMAALGLAQAVRTLREREES